MFGYAVILTTAGSEVEASHIARNLIERRLAACVNVVPGVRSIYRWQGIVHDDHEWLLMIKTRRDRFDAVHEAIRAIHSYEQPEIILIDVADGDEGYLRWIDGCLEP
jgi:periplasmic divalent cation tolerance protein